MKYWLMKSEPDVYSFDDLQRKGSNGDIWDGVRNYQARNFMMEMKKGDRMLFYHSNTNPPGVCGIAEIIEEAHPDPTQFDTKSKYYDPKSTRDKPRWVVVRVRAVEKLPRFVSLHELKAIPELQDFALVRKGNRLSVMPVHDDYVRIITKRASTDALKTP
jgi:predicted RNA-binding protein with PUA-like domain